MAARQLLQLQEGREAAVHEVLAAEAVGLHADGVVGVARHLAGVHDGAAHVVQGDGGASGRARRQHLRGREASARRAQLAASSEMSEHRARRRIDRSSGRFNLCTRWDKDGDLFTRDGDPVAHRRASLTRDAALDATHASTGPS
ncbi:unnamed protein product [Phytophthora lilii]|uniref:Unnamed protein product n=1 Tax=Phytophthora lilii TaxID=2077276 RepID=A0A9W6X0A8_9STRA|nr:unnamed protein product [Phytophthora lilii]